MSSICIVQDEIELKFVLSKRRDSFNILPLDLSSLLFCINHNIDYIDPAKLLDNNFHSNSILEVDNIINKLIYLLTFFITSLIHGAISL